MIKTLKEACKKQHKKEQLGQIDLDGSFTALFKRGLIDVKTMTLAGEKVNTWYVTSQGIKALSKLGFKGPC